MHHHSENSLNGLMSRSPHENGNADVLPSKSFKNMKKEENSRSPHSDNTSRSTLSIKVSSVTC